MDTPGALLRAEREKQKKSLDEIKKTLKIHLDYLQAIESDSYELLPPTVFLKAYLRLYAETLGLDPNYILQLYGNSIRESEVVKPALPEKESVVSFAGEKIPIRLDQRTFLWIIVVLTVIILLAVLMKPEVKEPVTESDAEVQEQAAAEMEMLLLKITASEITWVSVRIDGSKPREWLLRKGEVITLKAVDNFAVKVGNAGGTRLTLDGRDLGSLGPRGKVVDIVLP